MMERVRVVPNLLLGARVRSHVSLCRQLPFLLVFLVPLAGAGCAGTRVIHPGLSPREVEAVNRELRGSGARVAYVDGSERRWRRAEVTADSLCGTDAETGECRAAPIAALRAVSIRSAAAGGRGAAKWGVRAGATVGLAWGLASWNHDHLVGPWSTENAGTAHPATARRLLRTAGVSVLLGGAGGLVAIPVGVLAGAEVRFVVRARP
jgi:hypothetical protein